MSRATTAPQIQHHSDTGWTVARSPLTRHAYLVQHRGADVGWVLREDGGWRWLLTCSVRPFRHGVERTSRRTYRTWQAAVDRLARTDVGRHTTPHPPGTWRQHTHRPWEPEATRND
ncbi:hypothetical protein ACWGRK_18505 [Saccharomonospora azurea]|uniref:hypothetical protein n=1 Tax=Saccharomonospora azurea TaxID=40988 RepID=UPI00240A55FE|nr:hypothetical protein [Saccharomonospora azurea]